MEELSQLEIMKKYKTLGSRIAVLYRMDRNFYAKKLSEYGLGTSDLAVLLQISYFNELSQDQISTNIIIDKTSISKITKKLLNIGYIYMVRDKNDKRVHRLGLTLKGQKVIPVLKKVTKEWIEILVKGFKEEEVEMVCSILDKIIENVSEYQVVEQD
ncbi:MAG: MarR family transcriptional regulator [Eubacteriales bacterium]